jgi:hypothetical protein
VVSAGMQVGSVMNSLRPGMKILTWYSKIGSPPVKGSVQVIYVLSPTLVVTNVSIG